MKPIILCLALAAGIATAVLPTLAQSATNPPTITAVDYRFEGPDGATPTVTIPAGGSVQFAYPSGASQHNVDFGSSKPASCTQTAGPSSGSVPPLPASPTSPGWSGTCDFQAPGTYTFHCDLHPGMTGTVVVTSQTTSTGTTASTSTSSTTPTATSTTPATTTTTSSPGSPSAGTPGKPTTPPRRVYLFVAKKQSGGQIRFTIFDNRAGDTARGTLSTGNTVLIRFHAQLRRAGRTVLSLALPRSLRHRHPAHHPVRLNLTVMVAGTTHHAAFTVTE